MCGDTFLYKERRSGTLICISHGWLMLTSLWEHVWGLACLECRKWMNREEDEEQENEEGQGWDEGRKENGDS